MRICYNAAMPQAEELIESALEFLEFSCDLYRNANLEDSRRLKHSTISMSIGIELILRARLAREHWTLVLLSPDRYRQGDWDRGGFQPVDLREAMARLSEVCGVNISQQAETAFLDLADLRKKLIHFLCDESAERITGIQLRAWHYLMDLLDHDLLAMNESQEAALRAIKKQMLDREAFLASKFEKVRTEITARADSGSDIIMCPFCGHPALAVGDGAQCLVCGSDKGESREYAEEFARRSAPWMSSDEYYNTQWAAMCSECRQQACVAAPDELRAKSERTILEIERINRESDVEIDPWYCFNCGTVYDSFDIVECTRCGQLFARSGGESLCPDCSW